MRRALVFSVAAALAALVGACSATPISGAAKLFGTHDLALINRPDGGAYLFVTSTDNNELRVLDLAPKNVTGRLFVHGPNPLEPLSIPVVDRPSALAVDEGWSGAARITGPYVYASRPGGAEISVVGTGDDELREVRRLSAPGPVTATSGWYTGESRLYLATFDGARANLYSVDLPTSPDALRALAAADLARAFRLIGSFDGESVAALLVVPGLAGRTLAGAPFCAGAEGECVVVATRRARGSQGRTVLLDPRTLRSADLAFGGPVRLLRTHARAETGSARTVVEPGEHVFALLSEEQCGSSACGGVVAVDTRTATTPGGFPLALDALGLPMLPIRLGSSLPTSLAFGVNAQLATPASLSADGGAAGIGSYDVLGVVTASNGDVGFFDGAAMRHLDTDGDITTITNALFQRPDGTLAPWLEGPMITKLDQAGTEVVALKLADGAWRTQTIFVTWQGSIPALTLLTTRDADGTRLPIPAGTQTFVLPGDKVVLVNGAGDCGVATVVAVNADSLDLDAVPGGCVGRTFFTVRAGPAAPFVVTASTSGYLGRGAPGGTLTYTGSYVWRPDTFAGEPAMVMEFGTATVDTPPEQGSVWSIDVSAHFVPYVLLVDSGTCPGTQVPVSVVFDTARNRVFAAYPSPANGVIEIDPASFAPNTSANWRVIGNTSGTICYR